MILPIVAYGHPVLKKKAGDIPQDFPGLDELIANMYETMYAAGGVGLAGPQVNVSQRIFVIDASPFADDDPNTLEFKKVFINAQILERAGEDVLFDEGCLSFPGLREEIERPDEILIRYQNEKFEVIEERYSGIISRIIQHEYDHIDGILMVDHFSSLKKVILKRRLKEISVGLVEAKYKMKFNPK